MASGKHEIFLVCLVESSVVLLHDWSDVLVEYLSPLLQRIASGGALKGIRNELRIGFVSYSDPQVHPNPILAKRFFSPPFQLTKELKDDPASLGLGRAASSRRRGMAILEGYVAVLEMFDAIVHTRSPVRPQTSNNDKPEPLVQEPICYLIHIASSPPNKAKSPSWNTDPNLDNVTWESLPSHLLKRKIRTSMILTRPITELQQMYSNISRTPEPFWLPINKPSHKVFLSGLPPVPKDKTVPQKRQATDAPEASQSQPARPPPSEQHTSSPVHKLPATTSSTNSSNNSSANVVSTQTRAVSLDQPPQPPQVVMANLDPTKLVGYIKGLEMECRAKLMAIGEARAADKPKADIDIMQNELDRKLINRRRLLAIFQQLIAKQRASTGQAPLPSGQNSQPINPGQQPQQSNALASGTEQGTQPSTANAVMNPQFSAFGGVGNNTFQGIQPSARPGMEVQMQKMLAERVQPPVPAAAPQSQPQAPLPQGKIQPSQGNAADTMTPRTNLGSNLRRWHGILAWPAQTPSGRKENQIAIALFTQDGSLRCESWPQKLILQPSRVPMNTTTIQGWNRELNPVMGVISHAPIIDNREATIQNIRAFRSLRETIHSKNCLAFCKFDMPGGPPGTGIAISPTNSTTPNDILVAIVFNKTPLPAALSAHLSAQATTSDVSSNNDGSNVQQKSSSNNAATVTLQNMPAEAKAFLQQQQAAAIAAYSQQQVAQQAQQMAAPSATSNGAGPSSAFNVTQFMQGIPTNSENQTSVGGLNLNSASATQHRQASGFNPNLSMLQFVNRQPDEKQEE